MDTKAVIARFEQERQALALMDHPNVARVFDAGTTPERRPYFVMEYVHGLPITELCDRHRLTTFPAERTIVLVSSTPAPTRARRRSGRGLLRSRPSAKYTPPTFSDHLGAVSTGGR